MSSFQNLKIACNKLSENIAEFPVGAVSLEDFKPIEEKIKDIRENLKHLNARLLTLKAQHESQRMAEVPEKDEEETLKRLSETTANCLINNRAIRLCLHTNTIQAVLSGNEGSPEMQTKINTAMRKLFTYYDNMMLLQDAIESSFKKQLKLKIQCQNAIFEYKNFLQEQEELRSKKLQETNPEIAKKKEKMGSTLRKINIMKKLISNFIPTCGSMLMKEPMLLEMLEKHRELINTENILKMSQSNTDIGI